jgi:hypothetical protein
MNDVTKWHDPPRVPGAGETFDLQPKTTTEHTATLTTTAALGSSMNADNGVQAAVTMHGASDPAQPQAPAGMTPHGAPAQPAESIAPQMAVPIHPRAVGDALSAPIPPGAA